MATTRPYTSCCLVVLFLLCHAKASAESGDRYLADDLRLYDAIITNDTRHRYVRPVERASDAVQVEISLALIGLQGLDAKRQVMTSHVWVRLRWANPFMTWEPSAYGGLTNIMVLPDQIWTPDIVPHNSVSDGYSNHHTSHAIVYSTGSIIWITQSQLDTFCEMDLTYFPLDQHNCSIKFGSWVYDATKLNLSHWGDPELDLDYGAARHHSEWLIQNTSVVHHSRKYGCCSEPYHDITAYIILLRHHSYVIQMYVAPSAVFILLVPTIFMLPPESSHKFILGVGVLIAQLLLMCSLGDVIPVAHYRPPRLGLYFLCILVMVCVSMGMSALVANLWSRSKRRNYGVPGCVRVVLLKGLGRLLCVHYEDFLCVDTSREQNCEQYQYMTSLDTISQHSNNTNPLDDATMIREYNSHVVHRAEWRQLAAILDRAFCMIFWVISILTAVAMVIQF